MPRKFKVGEGDTLCAIALRGGLENCDAVRTLPENAWVKSRPLRAGDVITLPDLTSKTAGARTGSSTTLTVTAGHAPRIRFVHGSADLPFEKDATLGCLGISNFVTTKGGATQAASFPNTFGFSPDGDADPHAFKLEVSLGGAGKSIKVLLEALRPVYRSDGTVERHEPFAGSAHDARKLDVECEQGKGTPTLYRSRYLRLVTDDIDQSAASQQTLLVTDLADGKNGENDELEILDQRVRASMEVPTCKAPASERCRARAELAVGKDHRRVRLCIHVFRATPGGAPVNGLDEEAVRRRVRRWFRRAYAQAGLAPRLVSPGVEFIDPPPADMLVISPDTGLPASGVDTSGAASTLTFKLGVAPAGAPVASAAPEPVVSVRLVAGMTPRMVAAAIVGAIPNNYTAKAFPNPRGFSAAGGSCDVIVSKNDGLRILIRDEATTDTRLTLAVARIKLDDVDNVTPNLIPANAEMRRLVRSAEKRDDRLHYFIIERFRNPRLRGRAFIVGRDLALPFQPTQSLRLAVLMAATSSDGPVLDASDNLPFTFPHEAGHVLSDAFHADGPNSSTEMMVSGTSVMNAVNASKRICDAVKVKYAIFDPAQPTPGASKIQEISAVQRVRRHGAPVIERW